MKYYSTVFLLLLASLNWAAGKLTLSEIMYHPVEGGTFLEDDYEYLEFTNTGDATLALSGYYVDMGIIYVFPNYSLGINETVVVVKNALAFAERYPDVDYLGVFSSGSLKNSGETIRVTKSGVTQLEVSYEDISPWPVLADGTGFSLQLIDVNASIINDASAWTTSAEVNGNPGVIEVAQSVEQAVVINEVLTSPIFGDLDKIELYNSSDSTVDVSGWYISDDVKSTSPFIIPDGTTIEPNSFLVFDEDDFNPDQLGFSWSRKGDVVALLATKNGSLTGYEDYFKLDAMEDGFSFGRHVNSIGDAFLVRQSSSSFLNKNDEPLIGPLVINKILYAPDAYMDQFIELKNISNSTIILVNEALVDSNSYKISGVSFKFPVEVAIEVEAGQSVFLTAISPASFKSKYGLPLQSQVFQFTGTLSTNGEEIKIEVPLYRDVLTDGSYDNFYMTIDQVNFSSLSPWPDAYENGAYIQRVNNEIFGNDPANWRLSDEPIVSFTSKIIETNINVLTLSNDLLGIDGLEDFSYHMYNVNGVLVQHGASSSTIDIGKLDQGLYFLKVNETTSYKIIKD